jgi:hypothetical protein
MTAGFADMEQTFSISPVQCCFMLIMFGDTGFTHGGLRKCDAPKTAMFPIIIFRCEKRLRAQLQMGYGIGCEFKPVMPRPGNRWRSRRKNGYYAPDLPCVRIDAVEND